MAVRKFSEKIHTFDLFEWICLQRQENEFTSAEKAVMLFLGFVNLCRGFDYCLKDLTTLFFLCFTSFVSLTDSHANGESRKWPKQSFSGLFLFKAERLMEAIELYKEETLKMTEEGKVFVMGALKFSCLEVLRLNFFFPWLCRKIWLFDALFYYFHR